MRRTFVRPEMNRNNLNNLINFNKFSHLFRNLNFHAVQVVAQPLLQLLVISIRVNIEAIKDSGKSFWFAEVQVLLKKYLRDVTYRRFI